MKKYLLGMSAMAMLFATSCQDDMNLPGNVGETTTVAFNVATPQISTRAYSDGATATVLQYAVYDETGAELTDLTERDATINGSAEVKLQLTTGNTYSVIFWAAAQDAPYAVDFANKTMTVDYSAALSNDENRDAFYKYHTFTVNGAQTETIELKRPFAQLNIGTADLEETANAGYAPAQSAVTVKSLGNTLDLVSGVVSGEAKDITFGYAALPQGETFPVADNDYLAMNYLLVGTEKETVDIIFDCKDTNDAVKTRTVGSVPVQRNYRTNIYGQLLTSDVDVNVEIKPEYNEPAIVANLQYICSNGGTATLTEDVTLVRPLIVKEGVKVVLNLNDKSIINNTASEVFGEGEGIIVYGDLTINGTGTVQGKTMAVWARGNDEAKVTINGGTYKGCDEGFAKGGRSVVYASSGNVIDIYGGEFQALTADMTSYADKTNGVYAALNVADNNGMINVYGGRFYKQNPAAPGTEPSAWNTANPKGFVADGYKSTADGDWFVVAEAPAVTEVADANQFTEAIEDANVNSILATNDINLSDTFELSDRGEISIDMGGHSMTNTSYCGNILRNTQATISNGSFNYGFQTVYQGARLTFNSGEIKISDSTTNPRYCFYVASNAEVVINGGEFSFANVGQKRAYIYATNGATVYVKGGTFGKPSTNSSYKAGIMGTGTVIITGGTFGFDPSAWVADGYVATKNGTVWTVAKK
ncbi:MAG: DUF6562 domain-containing protein [Muribaculaceae bacterium]|nr:DUF6562 domain-containing protein [Muribaculaceae bacterium]